MKKYLSLAITLLLAASVSACGPVKDSVSAAEEPQKTENASGLPEKNSEDAAKNQKDSPAEEKTAEEENIAKLGEEVPEEALGYAVEEDPESPIDPANLPAEGMEAAIVEEAFGVAIEEEFSNPPEVAGTYTLYAWDEHGTIMKADEQNRISSMTLKEDGTGILQFDEETTVISEWGTSGTRFAMFYDEHGAADGTLDDGVIIVDPVDGDDILYFYAKEGVDLTKVLSTDREEYIFE